MHSLFHGLEDLLLALGEENLRAVGGSVRAVLRRDPLLGVDIDLATPLPPLAVQKALLEAKIPTSTPGIRWGTVTAQLAEKTYEITTLRQDTYLNGSRYPTVSFITSWPEDALRRDFTINAIYLSPNGDFFDPTGGTEDLKNGIVRFIGDPALRLREDPLRLLRFWRFCGHYGLGGLTPELAEIFRAAAPALTTLSHNRVEHEWKKLLATPQAATVQAEIERLGLMSAIQSRLLSNEGIGHRSTGA